jgi:hypothetical protein
MVVRQTHLKENYCTYKDYLKDGRFTRSFNRPKDLERHWKSLHNKKYYDCPSRDCWRKGSVGFTRKDHLARHIRGHKKQE